jgi:predicted SAM-dependent methyltransferase
MDNSKAALSAIFDSNINSIQTRDDTGTFNIEYLLKHRDRFLKTGELIPHSSSDGVALEIGATDLFQNTLEDVYGYSKIFGTIFSPSPEKRFTHNYTLNGNRFSRTAFNVNLEHEMIPLADESVDFILCGEVIEHFDIDPMFVLIEFNRILKASGKMLITTPNCCSARNLFKIINGYRPHFFMQYEISRSAYRHNFEYDIHALKSVVENAGFSTLRLETHDVFEPRLNDAYELIANFKFNANFRGDDIFLLASKTSGPINRWPKDIYV